jgi:hypothetical protein
MQTNLNTTPASTPPLPLIPAGWVKDVSVPAPRRQMIEAANYIILLPQPSVWDKMKQKIDALGLSLVPPVLRGTAAASPTPTALPVTYVTGQNAAGENVTDWDNASKQNISLALQLTGHRHYEGPIQRFQPVQQNLLPVEAIDCMPSRLSMVPFAAAAAAVALRARDGGPAGAKVPWHAPIMPQLNVTYAGGSPGRFISVALYLKPEQAPVAVNLDDSLFRTASGRILAAYRNENYRAAYPLMEKAYSSLFEQEGVECGPSSCDFGLLEGDRDSVALALSALTGELTHYKNYAYDVDTTKAANLLLRAQNRGHCLVCTVAGPLVQRQSSQLGGMLVTHIEVQGLQAVQLQSKSASPQAPLVTLLAHTPYAVAQASPTEVELYDCLRLSGDPSWYVENDLADLHPLQSNEFDRRYRQRVTQALKETQASPAVVRLPIVTLQAIIGEAWLSRYSSKHVALQSALVGATPMVTPYIHQIDAARLQQLLATHTLRVEGDMLHVTWRREDGTIITARPSLQWDPSHHLYRQLTAEGDQLPAHYGVPPLYELLLS